MISLSKTIAQYKQGSIDKQTFIQTMYDEHHSILFDYAKYLTQTNIKRIEIENWQVIMTSRDHGVRIACMERDFRIAPIETLNFLDYEKHESDMMENLISDGQNFFDIGANIWWYSINIAALRRLATVYCFEPIPKTYANLKQNIALNSVSNIIIYDFWFSDQAGEFTFYYYPEWSGNASSANVTGRTDVETVQCKLRTLDDYTAETKIRVDFIKCDVEGAELLVFKGAIDTIARDKPVIFSEILRKWSAKFNYNPNEIFDLLYAQWYQAFTVKNTYLSKFDKMDEDTIETNFFFLHSQKHQDIIMRFVKV